MASTPLTTETKAKANGIGLVRFVGIQESWIVGADAVHHMFLAKLVAVDEAVKQKAKQNLEFRGVWGSDPREAQYGFESDSYSRDDAYIMTIHSFFSGFANRDTAFLHPASKTLIYSKTSSSGKVPILGTLDPYMDIHKRYAWYMSVDKKDTVASSDFGRIIPRHDVYIIEKDGHKT
ncbi:uncharacterized protein B0H18DRAFT_1058834 [Fomitopsis serialis]|uniref:uncharacterized protein n=1 Tax=Fomitopsis serialis TaxID=139415 RepID=UPI0020082298|nr:uncharacterized protein B0H18DRAFT_1058834 [Neoantrodia serialis]KAH9911802.1 hypothetical protein B0H18DRAFT_1058834 [Neoantrodia serialis]